MSPAAKISWGVAGFLAFIILIALAGRGAPAPVPLHNSPPVTYYQPMTCYPQESDGRSLPCDPPTRLESAPR